MYEKDCFKLPFFGKRKEKQINVLKSNGCRHSCERSTILKKKKRRG
jgi:hypothetical protein